MTKNHKSFRLQPVQYKGKANFKFIKGKDFLGDDIESAGEWSEAEYQIESSCPEIDEFTITHAEHDGECLSASARIAGIVLLSVPWKRSDVLRPDQIKFLEAGVVSFISAGVDCVQDVNITLKTQDQTVVGAT